MSDGSPFSYDSTARAVHESLGDAFAAIPEGKRGALLVIADQDGARAMLAAKIGANWQLAAGAGSAWTGKVEGQIAIAGSW